LLLAAQVPAFGQQYAPRAYAALAGCLQKFKPKKNDEDAQRASDNVVAALIQLCLSCPTFCPDLDGCWSTVISKLPLKVDTEEGHKFTESFLSRRKSLVEAIWVAWPGLRKFSATYPRCMARVSIAKTSWTQTYAAHS